MKLIKIGSSQSCDLVLNSQYVSALHAEMTILDDGSIILEDKNSKNGTVVGNKRIEPGQEIQVQRGDRINFADVPLVWARIPAADKLSGYKQVLNIGTNYRNDIIVNSQTVSRFHASVRQAKDGKWYIHDNGSRNGTMLNGVKIPANKDERLKRGDNVTCGAEDISEQIKTVMPNSYPPIKKIAIAAGAIAGLAAVVAAVFLLWPSKGPTTDELKSSVVYVGANYHFVAEFEENPMSDAWDGKIEDIPAQVFYCGTAFFLDREGRMATNRHIAVPWEYRSPEIDSYIRTQIDERIELARMTIAYQLGQQGLDAYVPKMLEFLKTSLGKALVKHLENSKSPQQEMVNIFSRLAKSKYNISGAIDEIYVGYAGRNYTHYDEFQRCVPLCDSKDKDIDVAILQLNDKRTPDQVKYVFNPADFQVENIEPQKEDLGTIGYPAGLSMNLDKNAQSLEPSYRNTKCSKTGKYDFEIQESSIGGSSGSPIFSKNGHLVGILYGGYEVAGGSTSAVKAKFLKKMYEEEINI